MCITYTTQDELKFLNDLLKRGKIALIRKLWPVYMYRSWSGPGMDVDRFAIMHWFICTLGKRHVAIRESDNHDSA